MGSSICGEAAALIDATESNSETVWPVISRLHTDHSRELRAIWECTR